MKIGVIGKFSEESFGFHISFTLKKMGHDVIEYNYGLREKNLKLNTNKNLTRLKNFLFSIYENHPKLRKKISNQLFRFFSNFSDIDLIIVTYDWLIPYEVNKLKRICKSKIVLWYPDAISNMFRKSFFIEGCYDYVFSKEPYIVEALNKLYKLNISYLPECYNPYLHEFKGSLSEKDIEKYSVDISVVGNLHPMRSEIIKKLSNYNIKIWGNPPFWWQNKKDILKYYMSEYLIYQEKAKAFKLAKINLNTVHPAEIFGTNVRTFEIAGAGGFQIVRYSKILENLFDIEKELVVYNSLDELKEKIDYYLKRPEKRIEFANRSLKRAREEHTYEKRLTKLLKIVFK